MTPRGLHGREAGRLFAGLFVALLGTASAPSAQDRAVEKQLVVSLTASDLRGGALTEITWDGGLLVLQGVFTDATGELKAGYHLVPADGIELKQLAQQSAASAAYWQMKSNRASPTGLGRIESTTDAKMPAYGVGSLDQRVRDAVDMGGMQQRFLLRLGNLVLLERTGENPPYDGETYSWSPPELNRIAYVDAKGDLWVAMADGKRSQRVLRGDFTLPAWSADGRIIAVAERKNNGQRWDISVVHLPEALRSVPR